MSDNLVAFAIVYYVIGCIILFILLAGMDRFDSLVQKYGMYRGITLEVIIRMLIAAFWLPYMLFFYVRGLIRGD